MKNADLHGNVPDHSDVALLLIDVINDVDFPESEEFLAHALPAAQNIAKLTQQARSLGIPLIYVNDNFGKWQSNFQAQLQHCLRPESKGRPIAELLKPKPDDYFVLKPKHSAFYSTSLDILLRYLRAETLIITGFAGNICVLFTASDAYMRDFELFVPADCIASNTESENSYALSQMSKILKADVRKSLELDLQKVIRDAHNRRTSGTHVHVQNCSAFTS